MSNPTSLETRLLIDLINRMAPVGPTFREVMAVWGLKSPTQAKRRLDVLKAQGVIDWKPRCARSIHIRRAKFFVVKKDAPKYDAYLVQMEVVA